MPNQIAACRIFTIDLFDENDIFELIGLIIIENMKINLYHKQFTGGA